jgi:para-nitrobenzyl esterase
MYNFAGRYPFRWLYKETPASEKELKDLIKIDSGYISGTTVGEPGEEVHVYLGIPYAASPMGDLRWKPPQPVAPWSGVRECTILGTQAPQAPGPLPWTVETSEDCLWLSVMTPAKNATGKLPVMVWMHGGAYRIDTAANPTYNNFRLPQHGIVQVNVNMRLGVMGLLAHPLPSQESPKGVSGNYMFLDMIAALKWVQKNIAAFGGDPNNVTIWGYSGGSTKVINLMASPLAKGLFHKAICESGTPTSDIFNPRPMKETEALGEKLFAKLGVDKAADPLTAARALPWEKIIEADSALAAEAGGSYAVWGVWDLSLDGWFMPDSPLSIFQAGQQNAVPFIMGGNLGEITGPGMIVLPGTIPDYVKMLSSASGVGVKSYAYIFDQVPSKWKQEGCISTHAMETVYTFGNVDIPREWALIYAGLASFSGATSEDPGVTDVDRKVSEEMMSMWTQFAKTGDPNIKGLITWPAYEASADQYLYIADPLEVKSGFSKVGQ